MNTGKATLTVPEAAKMLGLGRNSAYEAVRNGTLPSIRFGKRIVIPLLAVERLLREPGRQWSDEHTQE